MPLPSQSSLLNLTAKVSNPAIFLMASRASSLSDKHRASLPETNFATDPLCHPGREVFTTLEIRMVGGSLFIIYEAD